MDLKYSVAMAKNLFIATTRSPILGENHLVQALGDFFLQSLIPSQITNSRGVACVQLGCLNGPGTIFAADIAPKGLIKGDCNPLNLKNTLSRGKAWRWSTPFLENQIRVNFLIVSY